MQQVCTPQHFARLHSMVLVDPATHDTTDAGKSATRTLVIELKDASP